jgi:hypothetical protein
LPRLTAHASVALVIPSVLLPLLLPPTSLEIVASMSMLLLLLPEAAFAGGTRCVEMGEGAEAGGTKVEADKRAAEDEDEEEGAKD